MKRQLIYKLLILSMLLSLLLLSACGGSGDSGSLSESSVSETSIHEFIDLGNNDNSSVSQSEIAEEIEKEVPSVEWDKIEDQMSELVNVGGNIWMNDDEKYEALTVSLNNIIASNGIAGTLVVATDSQIIYASGTNAYDIYGNTVSMNTTYGIGSINKTFTAACIMMLMEEGKVNLDDTIDKYFPDYKYGSDITIYQLLHMCSGLKGIGLSKGPETTRQDRYEMVLYGEYYDNYFLDNIIYPSELDFEPGSEMRYCNTNYFLLANIIEMVSGMTYEEYVTTNILEPLELKNTSLGCVKDITSRTADPDFTPDYMSTMEKTLKGYGAMHSVPLDILKFDRAIFNDKLFSQEYEDIMTAMQFEYGCGWMSENYSLCHYNPLGKSSPSRNIYHDGAVYSFRTSNCILNVDGKDGERIYIVWCNSSYTDLDVLIYDACLNYVNSL